jgi:hypothetical protein
MNRVSTIRARTDSVVGAHGFQREAFPTLATGAMGHSFERHFFSIHLALQNWWLQFR